MSAPRWSGGTVTDTKRQDEQNPLRCCNCGGSGRISAIYSDSSLPVLRISFDARGPGKPGLRRPLCRERRP
jgi:hypothetical protein